MGIIEVSHPDDVSSLRREDAGRATSWPVPGIRWPAWHRSGFQRQFWSLGERHREVPWMLSRTPLRPRPANRYAPQSRSGASRAGELARSLRVVKRIALQPLRWSPLVSQSGTQRLDAADTAARQSATWKPARLLVAISAWR